MSEMTPRDLPTEAAGRQDLSDPGDQGGLYRRLTLGIQAVIVIELGITLWRRDWENVVLTAIVIVLTMVPAFLSRRYRIYVPPEFQLIAAAFIFLSLFLGSARDYYYRFWWWDIVLHISSGFLLGIVGWITLFLMNKTDRLPPGIRPEFLAFFGVTFAVFLGVLWEIFEFVVDRIAPHINMQSNETGVADTMHDLIVDTIGAVIVAFMGLAYSRSGKYSFLVHAVRRFTRNNPSLFRRKA
jgi:ABC-type Fe3+-siderophore transport system permease subunit